MLASLLLGLGPAADAAAGCGDLDDDGVAGALDVSLWRTALADPTAPLTAGHKARCVVYGAPGPCDLLQLTVLRRHVADPGLAPGLAEVCSDGDQDGVADGDDACRATRPGALVHGLGCSTADLVLGGPEWFATDVAPALLAVAQDLEDSTALSAETFVSDLTSGIQSGVPAMQTALASLDTGDVCGASQAFATALAGVDTPRDALLTELPILQTTLARAGTPASGDHFGDGQLDVVVLQLALNDLGEAHGLADQLGQALAASCGAGQTAINPIGVVTNVDEANRVLELADGSTYILANVRTTQDFGFGEEVEGTGTKTPDNTNLLTNVGPTTPSGPSLYPAACLELQVAPVQPFNISGYGPPVLHEIDGYEITTGTATLEKGARLAVVSLGCPNTTPSLYQPYDRYSMRIEATGYGVLFDDLDPSDGVVRIPPQLPVNTPIALTLRERKHSCDPVQLEPCTPEAYRTSFQTLLLKPNGSLCSARYVTEEFKIEDHQDGQTDYRGTALDYVNVNGTFSDGIGNPEFRGEYCLKYLNGQSCNDALDLNMKGADPIPIWVDDFYPVHRPLSTLADIWHKRRTGVDHAGGLKWPHVQGSRSAKPYRYSCTLPALVRDRVDVCTGTDSFYRYPLYPGGNPPWNLAKDGPGHGPGLQSHAYDIDVDMELPRKKIRAARGGRVVLLEESFFATDAEICWSNMGSNCDLGNYLYIRHQDGTHATYWHMPQNGVYPQLGQIVRRSDEIGEVGDTGNSFGPHVHFHVQDLNGVDSSPSITIKFQTPGNVCVVPVPGDPMLSNNDPSVAY